MTVSSIYIIGTIPATTMGRQTACRAAACRAAACRAAACRAAACRAVARKQLCYNNHSFSETSVGSIPAFVKDVLTMGTATYKRNGFVSCTASQQR